VKAKGIATEYSNMYVAMYFIMVIRKANMLLSAVKVKVKKSHYRPGVTQRVTGS
jgi:hypothetical protein